MDVRKEYLTMWAELADGENAQGLARAQRLHDHITGGGDFPDIPGICSAVAFVLQQLDPFYRRTPVAELPHADELRRQHAAFEDERGSQIKTRAIDAVLAAHAGHKTSVDLSHIVSYPDHDSMQAFFQDKGYTVSCGDSQRDGAWFSVSW